MAEIPKNIDETYTLDRCRKSFTDIFFTFVKLAGVNEKSGDEIGKRKAAQYYNAAAHAADLVETINNLREINANVDAALKVVGAHNVN